MSPFHPTRACCLVLLLAAVLAAAPAAGDDPPTGNGGEAGPSELLALFDPFSELLSRYLRSADLPGGGRVTAFDYEAALEGDDLERLLADQDRRLAAFDPGRLDDRARATAFWINAYNYFMIAHVLREAAESGELVDSVKDFGSLFRPYAVFGRELFDIGGREMSLDGIEKGTLFGDRFRERGWFDPRVHFAVNCASVGCPSLRPELYDPHRIDDQLEDNTRRSLATDLHLRIDGDRLRWTELFDWYEDDFEVGDDSVRDFVLAHVDGDRADAVRNARRSGFIDYDWRLNRPDHFERLGDPAGD